MAHLVADWLLQNEWMSNNKTSLRHPASWVHSGIHFLCLLLVMPWAFAMLVALIHLLVDTRVPLAWWRRIYRQTSDPQNPAFVSFAMWQDQVVHILVLYAACWFLAPS
jgi:hypothetical protein